MKVKKKVMMLIDILILTIISIIAFSFCKNTVDISKTIIFAESEKLGFNLITNQSTNDLKGGETVTMDISVADFGVGENGLNNITGNIDYDKNVLQMQNIDEKSDWKVVLNQENNNPLNGKFCMYKLSEGENQNQAIATFKFKVNENVTVKSTEITLKNVVSSNGEQELKLENKKIVLNIKDSEEVVPQDPEEKEDTTSSEQSKEQVTDKLPIKVSPQTGDKIILVAILIIAIVVILNILIFIRKGKKRVIISVIVAILFTILGAGIVLAENEDLSKQEKWLNSTKYLVTDDSITRVLPKTTVQNLKVNLNKDLIIYDNEQDEINNKQTEKQYVASGMKVKAVDEQSSYLVNVLGDVNKDGLADGIDLTKIIRNVVNPTKWTLDNNEKMSADLTIDSQISVKDVEKLVKYIVFGEMNVEQIQLIQAPEISVIRGTYDEINVIQMM